MTRDEGAGRRAQQMADRAAAHEAELERALAKARQRRAGWEAGAAGERAVAEVLETLTADGWQLLHDVHWPGRPVANLDHVAVGPGGIVVVDAKNWTGSVTVREDCLRQNGYRRDAVVASAGAAGAAVAALLAPRHRTCVHSVVCLVQHPLDPQRLPLGATVLGADHLAAWMRALPPVLHPAAVSGIHAFLGRQLTGPTSPAQTTTAALAQAGPAPVPPPRAATRRTAPPAQRRRPPRADTAQRQRRRRQRWVGADLVRLLLAAVVVLLCWGWLTGLSAGGAAPPTVAPPGTVSR